MIMTASSLLCVALLWNLELASGFAAIATAGSTSISTISNDLELDASRQKNANVLTTVAVTGATGRTGRLVVQELLKRGVPKVIAIVRNETKASQVFDDVQNVENLDIVSCDLTSETAISDALQSADAAIWCATGFSDAQPPPQSTSTTESLLSKFKKLLGIKERNTKPSQQPTPRQSIDLVGIQAVAKCMITSAVSTSTTTTNPATSTPKVVMLSSAGVTRPTWDDKKKSLFPGAADIPIVRLNPFGILDMKRASEEALRASGVEYCIVRPAGLNDDWPAGSRPILTQGDVAVGRINRKDVAEILVEVLTTPEATGKTFEAISVAGYPKSVSLSQAVSRLIPDKDGLPSFDSVYATYSAMQQLLPGEKQDSAALAMGQTYEELDKGKIGRLGKRGEENVGAAAPKPSS